MSLCADEFNICWKIENYLYCDKRNGNPLVSPSFTSKNMNSDEWKIFLFPRGSSMESDGYVSLHIYCSFGGTNTCEINDLNILLCNAEDEVIATLDKKDGIIVEINNCYLFKIEKVFKTEALQKQMKKFSNDFITVRCRISMQKNADVKNPLKINEIAKTTVDFDMFSKTINIKLDQFSNTIHRKIVSGVTDLEFEIIIKECNEVISIDIHRAKRYNNGDYTMKCQMLLLNKNPEILSTCDFFFFCKSLGKDIWSFSSFLKTFYFTDKSSDYFFLKFNFFVSNGMSFSKYTKETVNLDCSSLKKISENSFFDLQSDLHAMLSNKKYADVKLLVNNETMYAHKSILASRSPVFATMFDQDMIENQTGTIHIPDISIKSMKLFLKFLYTGMLDKVDSDTLLELLLTAEKYQVPSFKEKCSQMLILFLNFDNICDVVSVADMIKHAELKETAINYIRKHAAAILCSSKWLEWIKKNVILGSEILCKFSNIIAARN